MREEDDRLIGRTSAVVAGKRRVIPWIWEGVVAEGTVTLLSAPEKVGKTTFLSPLLDRRRAGGQLLGRTVYPGKTVLCSEENDSLRTQEWDKR
jgi:RecA-family ATPase